MVWGFDETSQWVESNTPQNKRLYEFLRAGLGLAQYMSKEQLEQRKRVRNQLLRHTMVQSCHITCEQKGAELDEHLHIPPQMMEGQTALTIFTIVVGAIERFLCNGVQFTKWLLKSPYRAVVISFSADRAAANMKFFRLLRCLQRIVNGFKKTFLLIWHEPCCIHVVIRCLTSAYPSGTTAEQMPIVPTDGKRWGTLCPTVPVHVI